jgi:vacuolar protein sorting-associated protein 45
MLADKGLTGQQLSLLDALLAYAGDAKRAAGLFNAGSIMAKMAKTFTNTVHGAENVYTQHQPLLFHTLNELAKGKIKDSVFPPLAAGSAAATARPSEVIVFIVGGATYEEATKVAEFNNSNPTMKVLLGGSCVHNSTSFLNEIGSAFGSR